MLAGFGNCGATLTLHRDVLPLTCDRPHGHDGPHSIYFSAGGYEWTDYDAKEATIGTPIHSRD